jgi:hypothetical protein
MAPNPAPTAAPAIAPLSVRGPGSAQPTRNKEARHKQAKALIPTPIVFNRKYKNQLSQSR